MERRTPISVEKAVEKVMAFARTGEVECAPIEECDGRFLAEDLIADHPVPAFDRSGYDGYAVRSEDLADASLDHPVELEVIEAIGAGAVAAHPLLPGQAVRIMTGAQMPVGADAVIMLELTEEIVRNGKKWVRVKRKVRKGDHVTRRGADVQPGIVLAEKGTQINPGIKALLATFGYSTVKVAKRPVIGLYVTGSELLDPDEPLVPGKIRNSNSFMICSQILRAGAVPKYYGKLKDDLEDSLSAIRQALEEVDILITTGGVSVGDFDYLPAVYDRLGAEVLFNKIGMRPGSVTTVAHWSDKLLFGLSGNPSACYVGFELFVRPLIRSLLFCPKPHLKKIAAILDADFPKANPFTRFVRSKVTFREAKVYVSPSGQDKSNVVSSLAQSNALMILPGGTQGFTRGMETEVLLLEDQEGSFWPWNQS